MDERSTGLSETPFEATPRWHDDGADPRWHRVSWTIKRELRYRPSCCRLSETEGDLDFFLFDNRVDPGRTAIRGKLESATSIEGITVGSTQFALLLLSELDSYRLARSNPDRSWDGYLRPDPDVRVLDQSSPHLRPTSVLGRVKITATGSSGSAPASSAISGGGTILGSAPDDEMLNIAMKPPAVWTPHTAMPKETITISRQTQARVHVPKVVEEAAEPTIAGFYHVPVSHNGTDYLRYEGLALICDEGLAKWKEEMSKLYAEETVLDFWPRD